MKRIFVILFLFIAISIYPQVKWSGDARIRPRYDINDKTAGGGNKTTDMYYMYRARLRLKADIGDNWAFNTMISHNGAYFYSKFGSADFPEILGTNQTSSKTSSRESSRRATLSFMELYFGKETKDYGVIVGLFPLNSINNPIYDIHYYPNKTVDIPHAIFNSDGAFGLSGYYQTTVGKFGAKLFVEDAKGKEEENPSGDILSDINDQYTLELNYTNTLGDFVINPQALISISSEKDSACTPNSFGLNITSPKLSTLTLSGSAIYTFQNNEKLKPLQEPGFYVSKYNGYYLRLKLAGKLGFGNLLAWVDYAKITEDLALKDNDYNFYFTWIAYEMPIYKSESGAVSITPELRYAYFEKNEKKTSDRLKLEVNFDIKF